MYSDVLNYVLIHGARYLFKTFLLRDPTFITIVIIIFVILFL